MNTLPAAASTEHLTEALRASDALPHGRVSDVASIGSVRKLRSHTHRLRLDYDNPVANAPRSVILKTGYLDEAGRPAYANQKEIAFYREIAPVLPTGLVPRCFEAIEVTDTTAWHLLLEDLTESHSVATEWPLPPSFEQCQSMIRALARIHAVWWDHPRLGVSVGNWCDAAVWDQILQNSVDQFTRFTDRFSEMVPPERRDLYERLFDRARHLLGRYDARHNLTIAHGDAHSWNFFLPRPRAARTSGSSTGKAGASILRPTTSPT